MPSTIQLRTAQLIDRPPIYEWFYHSDLSPFLLSLESITKREIPTLQVFTEDFEDFFFTGDAPDRGRSYIIQLLEESLWIDIGCIHYTAYHLKNGIAELDIWMKSKIFCGKGYGTSAIIQLAKKLADNHIKELIIRPSKKNKAAIRSYQKAGFQTSDLMLQKYYHLEYISCYGAGDYGMGGDVFMSKKL